MRVVPASALEPLSSSHLEREKDVASGSGRESEQWCDGVTVAELVSRAVPKSINFVQFCESCSSSLSSPNSLPLSLLHSSKMAEGKKVKTPKEFASQWSLLVLFSARQLIVLVTS